MFEKASRRKLRFPSPKGLLSVEDLWDLPLTSNTGKANLDDIAKTLFAAMKETEISFVAPAKTESDSDSKLAFEIVKRVIDVRLAENAAAAVAADNRKRKQLILDIIAQKQNEQLLGSSLEDLQKLADSL